MQLIWKWIGKNSKALFFAILALLVGLGLAIDWNITLSGTWVWDVSFSTQLETEKSAWDIVASIGALLGGSATIGLLWVAASARKDWEKSIHYSANIEDIRAIHNRLDLLFSDLEDMMKNKFLSVWVLFHNNELEFFKDAPLAPHEIDNIRRELLINGAEISQFGIKISAASNSMIEELKVFIKPNGKALEEEMNSLKNLESCMLASLRRYLGATRNVFNGDELLPCSKENSEPLRKLEESFYKDRDRFMDSSNRIIRRIVSS